jgi:hypothetical protein
MIMTLIYDTPVLEHVNDPSAVPLNNFVDQLAHAAYPGAYLVEFFTWMRYLPLWMAKWKYEAVTGYKKYSTIFSKLYDDVCQRVVSSCWIGPRRILKQFEVREVVTNAPALLHRWRKTAMNMVSISRNRLGLRGRSMQLVLTQSVACINI